jgi:hypothetical protein
MRTRKRKIGLTMRSWAIVATLLLPPLAAHSSPTQPDYRTGDVFAIQRDAEMSETSADEPRGSSTDRDMITERIIGTSAAGLELEYDLPKSTTAEDRARQWQLPARVLKPHLGSLQLLNRPELEARAAAWLKAAGLSRAACGHWYFTWNAFQIECDPQSVLEMIEAFDVGPDDLKDGAQYRDSKALNPLILKSKGASTEGSILVAETVIDPEAVRRDQAQADVVVGEITRKPVTFEAALQARSSEPISGTIAITFEIDPAGHVRKRTRVTTLNINWPDGQPDTKTTTETLERRLISPEGS